MSLDRRNFVLTALSTTATFGLLGCVPTRDTTSIGRPGASFDDHRPIPVEPDAVVIEPQPTSTHTAPAATPRGIASLSILARTNWTAAKPNTSNINPPLGKVKYITVHHEGWQTVNFTDLKQTKERLELIRRGHVQTNRWSDIGYHYIIDRAGRIWEARSTQHQGAHVKGRNPNNLGIMVLGNFDNQHPSSAQLSKLQTTLKTFMNIHNIPVKNVKTHQEWSPTKCPGKTLQAKMGGIRQSLA